MNAVPDVIIVVSLGWLLGLSLGLLGRLAAWVACRSTSSMPSTSSTAEGHE